MKYIPIINIIEALKVKTQFEVYHDQLLEKADILGLLEEMTKEEKNRRFYFK